ncbi:ribbon-helix-helix protein, CopG family [Nocardia sp. NPDC060249]|uniref:type II toxin-antitoxin system VapB family antitoxin n=1 Tax=Nocardia sp. NPDC060249 TaxID=3347082 RepID=UPI00366566A8
MTDILIRDVPESAIREVDRRAEELGISRGEFLRRWLARDFQRTVPVTVGDLNRVAELAQDLDDPEVMRRAWS